MLPSKRPFHATMFATGILSKFPAWMKLQKPESVGFRFVDAIVGNELELFKATLDIYKDYIFISKAPIDSLEYLEQIELPYFLKDTLIYATDGVEINVVENSLEFLTNPPTRIVGNETISPSGLEGYNIVGLEWIDGFPSGFLIIKRDSSDIAPSSLLYYDIITKNNEIDLFPSSGITLGIGYVGLGNNSIYDVGVPESEWSLRKKYSATEWITTSGTISTTAPSDLVWSAQSFVDPITGLKTYYRKMLNNPYGSGVYDQSDIQLTYIPISGSLKITDPYNLTSGVPTVIPSSGLNVYGFTSGYFGSDGLYHRDQWTYKGFENPIPWEITPRDIQNEIIVRQGSGVPIVPTLIGNVSWRLLPSGGYVDDEVYPHLGTFNWIEGTGGSGNIIRFSGGFSKYKIEYNYQLFSAITQISADPKSAYKAATPSGGQLYFITGNDFFQPIKIETSLSNPNAVRIDPYVIRPGTTVYYTLRMNTQKKDVWMNARNVDKTIQFYNHNIGYTDNLGLRNDL